MINSFFPRLHTVAQMLSLAALSLLCLAGTALAQASLQDQLSAQYPLASATNGCNVGNPDTALSVQKAGGGLRILPVSSNVTIAKCINRFVDGQLKTPGTACNGESLSKAGGVASKIPRIGNIFGKTQPQVDNQVSTQQMTVAKTGDTVYPTRLDVNESKGEVKFSFIACQQSDNQQQPYKGELVFQFSKDMLKVENIGKIEDVIAQVLAPDGNDQQAQGGDQGDGNVRGSNGQGGGGGQQQDQGSACNPELGQTVEQVVNACGNPASAAKGANGKQIYNYNQPKLKIIFMNGKVSDVE